jgi:hypothetical protein
VRLRAIAATVLGLVVIAQAAGITNPAAQAAAGCGDTTGARAGKGGFTGHADRKCGEGAEATGAAVVTRVVDCGPPKVAGQNRANPGDVCGRVRNVCDVATAGQLPKDPKLTTTATQQRNPDGTWRLVGTNCFAPTAAPQLTAAAVLREVRRLVPHPKVGIAPPGGATLVNIQTLLWAETPVDQSLGTVTLLGHRVALRVRVARVDWDFGDGTGDTTTSPEPKYNPAAGCHTVDCPGYWGHVYTATGAVQISATVSWSGRYRVDGGAWLDIPDTVTGPAMTAALTVRQARGILVPNPNPDDH